MFDQNDLLTASVYGQVRNPPKKIAEMRSSRDANMRRIVPPYMGRSGQLEWPPLNFAMFCLAGDLVAAEFKIPLAAKIACRVMDAHLASPEVEQWAVVTTENGNTSTLAVNGLDLSTGFISGARLSFAMIVDLRTYDDRVERAWDEFERAQDDDDAN